MAAAATGAYDFCRSYGSTLAMYPRRGASRAQTLVPAHLLWAMLVAAIILIFGSGILDASPTLAAEPASSVIAGRASVIDGDTLEIHG